MQTARGRKRTRSRRSAEASFTLNLNQIANDESEANMTEYGNLSPGTRVPKTGDYKCLICGPDGLASISTSSLGRSHAFSSLGRAGGTRKFFREGELFDQCPNCDGMTGWELQRMENVSASKQAPPSKPSIVVQVIHQAMKDVERIQQEEQAAKKRVEDEHLRLVQERRKGERRCVNCGRPLGVLDRLLKRVRHRPCTTFLSAAESQDHRGSLRLCGDRLGHTSKRVVVQFKASDGDLSMWLCHHAYDAKAQGLIPTAQFYGDWCGACRKLRASIDHALMADALAGTYTMQVELDLYKTEVNRLGFQMKAIPIFFILDEKGLPVGPKIGGEAWGDDIPENMAPPLKAFFDKFRTAKTQLS